MRHERERDYCRILTVDDEKLVVEYIKNKNRSYQPMNRNDVEKLVLNILRIRQHQNKPLGHINCTELSRNANDALARGSLGRRFWMRFNAAYSDLSIKRRENVSLDPKLVKSRVFKIKPLRE